MPALLPEPLRTVSNALRHGHSVGDGPLDEYAHKMNWAQLDFPTRAGFVATIMAILGVLVPPVSVASACVAIAFSGFGWQRSRRRGESNRVARLCAIGCTAFVVLVVVGSAVYGAAN